MIPVMPLEILRDADAAMYKAKVYRATTHFLSP